MKIHKKEEIQTVFAWTLHDIAYEHESIWEWVGGNRQEGGGQYFAKNKISIHKRIKFRDKLKLHIVYPTYIHNYLLLFNQIEAMSWKAVR